MHKRNGFTIVELLIVIVVIAILAAVSIVAYNGVQQRARDSNRKSDLSVIAKALQMYNIDNGNYAVSDADGNCTGNAGAGGWYNHDYDGTGPLKTVDRCLTDGGYLSQSMIDPSGSKACSVGTSTCFAYMKYTCASGTYIYAHLETEPISSTALDGTCASAWDSEYGMNYVVKVGQ